MIKLFSQGIINLVFYRLILYFIERDPLHISIANIVNFCERYDVFPRVATFCLKENRFEKQIPLILFLCGLGVSVSIFLKYRASAETEKCSPRSPCVPDVQPPDCEKVVGYKLRGVRTFHKTVSYPL